MLAKDGYQQYANIKPENADPFVFVDVDHCIDVITGKLTAQAEEIIARFHSYTEKSPSGTGLHILSRGRIPYAFKIAGIEMYEVARYTTLTGNLLDENLREIASAQDAIDWLVEKLQEHANQNNGYHHQSRSRPHVTPHHLTDTQLVAKIRDSKQGPLFHELYDTGAWQNRYPSQSEGVWALLRILAFWTQCTSEQIDRLFRGSKMMRDKWEDKWDAPRGDTTLGELQIARIIEMTDEVYEPSHGS